MRITKKLLQAFNIVDSNRELYKQILATETRYLSDNIGVRNIIDDDGRVKVSIVVDNQVAKSDVIKVWPQIESIIDNIVQKHGPDLSDYFQVLLMGMVDGDYSWMRKIEGERDDSIHRCLEKGKPQYRDLFMDANFDLLLFIIRISKIDKDKKQADLASHYFSNLLRNYQFTEIEIAHWRDESILEINDGRCPFDIYRGPIDFEKFVNKVEYLVKRYGNEKRSPISKPIMLDVYRWFVTWGDWKDADRMLRKSYPITYEKYIPRAEARLDEIMHQTSKIIDNLKGTSNIP
jgi:hypothetical protein